MLIKCPACGSRNSLDVLLNDDDATRAVLAAMRISSTGKLLVSYLTLFRPKKTVLTMKRLTKLLEELQPLIDAQRIVFDGVVYDTPVAVWEVSLEKVIQQRDQGKLQTPLDNHNYLFRVIITECGKQQGNTVGLVETQYGQAQGIAPTKLSGTAQALVNLEMRKGGNHVVG